MGQFVCHPVMNSRNGTRMHQNLFVQRCELPIKISVQACVKFNFYHPGMVDLRVLRDGACRGDPEHFANLPIQRHHRRAKHQHYRHDQQQFFQRKATFAPLFFPALLFVVVNRHLPPPENLNNVKTNTAATHARRNTSVKYLPRFACGGVPLLCILSIYASLPMIYFSTGAVTNV